MEALVGEYERSGMTQKAFAWERGISVANLQYWRRKARSRAKPQLVEVHPLTAMHIGSAARIELPGHIIIHIEGALPVEALARLSRALS